MFNVCENSYIYINSETYSAPEWKFKRLNDARGGSDVYKPQRRFPVSVYFILFFFYLFGVCRIRKYIALWLMDFFLIIISIFDYELPILTLNSVYFFYIYSGRSIRRICTPVIGICTREHKIYGAVQPCGRMLIIYYYHYIDYIDARKAAADSVYFGECRPGSDRSGRLGTMVSLYFFRFTLFVLQLISIPMIPPLGLCFKMFYISLNWSNFKNSNRLYCNGIIRRLSRTGNFKL